MRTVESKRVVRELQLIKTKSTKDGNMFKAFVARKVYISFKPLKVAEGFVTSNGKILAAGTRKSVEALSREFRAGLRAFDGIVMPGFVDSHIHLDSLGLSLNTLDLRGVRSIEMMKDMVRDYAETRPGWIFGRGWDQDNFSEGRWPNRWDVDEAVADRPVILVRICGHVALLNTRALELLEPRGSEDLWRDEKGEVSGLIAENLVEETLANFWGKLGDDAVRKCLLDGMEHCAANGVTSVGTCAAHHRDLCVLSSLREDGKLKVRIRAYVAPELTSENKCLTIEDEEGYLRVVGVKAFSDGSLGARTAYLREPYRDEPSRRGNPLISESGLLKIGTDAERMNLQLATHAIGDAALDIVLGVYSKLNGVHRIIHASVTRPEQIEKMAAVKAVAIVQPRFVISDWWVLRRVGREMAGSVYAFKSLCGAGVPVAFSTDAPVEPLNPWETVYAAVTRGENEGVELAILSEKEKITVQEALHLYTYGSAVAIGEEKRLGTLEPGKYADFIVVDEDPMTIPPEEVRRIKVLGTYVGGNCVFADEELVS